MPNSIKPKRGPKGRATKECRERGCHGKRHRDGYCSKHDYKHNAEYHKARARKYYPKYKETILVRTKKRYLLHRDEINKQNKIKYHSNLKKSRKASNKYYQENKAHLSAEERKYQTKVDIKVLGYIVGDDKNQEQPKIVRRQNAVEVKIPRERVIYGDINEFIKDGFYRE